VLRILGAVFLASVVATVAAPFAEPTSALTTGSLVLNGASSYAEVASTPDLNITGDWTVQAWFKDTDPNGWNHDFRQILMKGDRNANADAPYYILVGRNSILAGVRSGGQDYPIQLNLTDFGLRHSRWHHVAVTFRADLNVLNLWLDGQHVGYLIVPTHSTVGNNSALEIGRNGATTGKYWIGNIQDVQIWNFARKGLDINSTYRNLVSGPQPGLVAHWNFNDSLGSVATDSAGNHTAVLNSGAAFSSDAYPPLVLVNTPGRGGPVVPHAVLECTDNPPDFVAVGETIVCNGSYRFNGFDPLRQSPIFNIAPGDGMGIVNNGGFGPRQITVRPGFTCGVPGPLGVGLLDVTCAALQPFTLEVGQNIPVFSAFVKIVGVNEGLFGSSRPDLDFDWCEVTGLHSICAALGGTVGEG
jgi:hypothetical protein